VTGKIFIFEFILIIMFVNGVSFNQKFYDGCKNSLSDKFPFNLDIFNFFKSENSLIFNSNITFFVGENGCGKTTFVESFAYNLGLNKFGGSKNFVLDESEKPILSDFLLVGRSLFREKDSFFFRAENFFNLQKDIDNYGGNNFYSGDKDSFREMSHGQGFKTFFENRIGENGIYIFDEPESALSVQSQIEFLFLLKELSSLGNQIFIITHSPIILSFPGAEIFDVSDNFNKVDYKDSVQFNDMKNFIDYVDRYRKDLL
jgi:predicted ATPase